MGTSKTSTCQQTTTIEKAQSVARTVPAVSSRSSKPIMSTMIGSTALAVLLLASTFLTGLSAQNTSTSVDQPNPIAQMYPDLISGNLNGTTMIIPIAIAVAQSLVPEYSILESGYMSLLPTFPQGMYPLVVTAKHDHDIQLAMYNLSLADFTVRCTASASRLTLRYPPLHRANMT